MKSPFALLAASCLVACVSEAGHIIPWLTISKSIFIKPVKHVYKEIPVYKIIPVYKTIPIIKTIKVIKEVHVPKEDHDHHDHHDHHYKVVWQDPSKEEWQGSSGWQPPVYKDGWKPQSGWEPGQGWESSGPWKPQDEGWKSQDEGWKPWDSSGSSHPGIERRNATAKDAKN
uniref:Putative potassium voltage-gated channel protein shaw n=1 Tax=Ixodes ricinus TaxID=34613 RepID=A0A147BGK2_IXORI